MLRWRTGSSINAVTLLLPSHLLQKILSEHSGPGSSRRSQSGRAGSLPCGGHAAVAAAENPRAALSPLTNSLLEQLEARIKELKAWLRDTELLIFNSCLKEHRDASQQLHSFKVRRALTGAGLGQGRPRSTRVIAFSWPELDRWLRFCFTAIKYCVWYCGISTTE